MSLTTSDFVYLWRVCPTMFHLGVQTGGYISLYYAPHVAIPCLEGSTEVKENECDAEQTTSGVSPGSSNGARCDI